MAVLTRALLSVVLSAGIATSAAAVSEGEGAPRVELASLEGEPIDLASLQGRVVVLDFWATWCAPCVDQLRALEAFTRTASPDDVVVVAASIDDAAERPRRFLAEKFPDAKFRSAHDPGGVALASFGADAIPAMYVIDRRGIVRHRHFGPGGGDRLDERVAAALVH